MLLPEVGRLVGRLTISLAGLRNDLLISGLTSRQVAIWIELCDVWLVNLHKRQFLLCISVSIDTDLSRSCSKHIVGLSLLTPANSRYAHAEEAVFGSFVRKHIN